MAALFIHRSLVVNNKDNDELELERELTRTLENKVMLLYFGSGECPRCREFAPILKEFFVKLTDEFYVERASQLVLIYVSLDKTEEKQDKFLKTMPKRWLFLPFQDEFKKIAFGTLSALQYTSSVSEVMKKPYSVRELALRFSVTCPPAVVVLKPNGEVIAPNAVEEIKQQGIACFKNWQEAADLVDRNFLLAQDFEDLTLRSITDPFRRFKYKLAKNKRELRSKDGDADGVS